MTSAPPSWDEMTEAEQAGVIQRTAVHNLDSPYLRQWTADHLRQESPVNWFIHQVADAMDAELAAREARTRLRIVASARWRLPSPGAAAAAPRLRVLEGYAPSPFAEPARRPSGKRCRKPRSR